MAPAARRPLGLAALAAAAASLLVMPTAGSQAAPQGVPAYEASSSAQALELSLFGQGIIVGQSSSRVSSGGSGADGLALAGVMVPLILGLHGPA
mgnify:CR=1 FL=1